MTSSPRRAARRGCQGALRVNLLVMLQSWQLFDRLAALFFGQPQLVEALKTREKCEGLICTRPASSVTEMLLVRFARM